MNLRDLSLKLSSSLEARILVKHITTLSDSDLIGVDNISLDEAEESWLNHAIEQRLNGRPISKIIGYKEFYGRNFIITDDVLDPRPDSETLIDAVLEYAKGRNDTLRILDLGTGSGCLILTLLAELPNATGFGTDISDNALSIAAQNASALNMQNRVQFIKSNWLESIAGKFDIIVSNPPYIETRTLETLDKDVREFDPIIALDGGIDGLTPYKILFPQIRGFLNYDGFVAMEHGTRQHEQIQRLIDNAHFKQIRVHYDLGGHDRVTSALAK